MGLKHFQWDIIQVEGLVKSTDTVFIQISFKGDFWKYVL